MTAYADSSFITKLYLKEPLSPLAFATLGTMPAPVRISELTELEARNAFNSAVFDKRITPAEAATALNQLQTDMASGLLISSPLSATTYSHAAALSDRHTPQLRTRTLDLIHVAAALELNVDTFLSFDNNQKKAASAEGMTLLPAVLP